MRKSFSREQRCHRTATGEEPRKWGVFGSILIIAVVAPLALLTTHVRVASAPAEDAGVVDVVVHVKELIVLGKFDWFSESDPFVRIGVNGVEDNGKAQQTSWGGTEFQDEVPVGQHADKLESHVLIFKGQKPAGGKVDLRVGVFDYDPGPLGSDQMLPWMDFTPTGSPPNNLIDASVPGGASIKLEVTFLPSCTGNTIKGVDPKRDIVPPPPNSTGPYDTRLTLDVDETNPPTSLSVKEIVSADLEFQNANPAPVISAMYVDGEEFTVAEWTFAGAEIRDRDIDYQLGQEHPSHEYFLFGYATTDRGTVPQRGDIIISPPTGGIAQLPDVAQADVATPDSSAASHAILAEISAGATAALLALTGAWHARRRWLG